MLEVFHFDASSEGGCCRAEFLSEYDMGKVTAGYQINKVTCLGHGVKPVLIQGGKIPKA